MVSTIRRTLLACLQVYKQWGVVKSNGVLQTFPLAFATRCFAVAVTANIGSSYAVASSAWDVNKTSAIFYVDTTNAPSAGWYYAIGIQQWGYTEQNTVTLPIAYTKYYCVAMSTSWGYAAVKIENLAKLTFVDTHSASELRYITIGV